VSVNIVLKVYEIDIVDGGIHAIIPVEPVLLEDIPSRHTNNLVTPIVVV